MVEKKCRAPRWEKEDKVGERSIWLGVPNAVKPGQQVMVSFNRPGCVDIQATEGGGLVVFVYDDTNPYMERDPILHFDGEIEPENWPDDKVWIHNPGDEDLDGNDALDILERWIENRHIEQHVLAYLRELLEYRFEASKEDMKPYDWAKMLSEEYDRVVAEGMRSVISTIQDINCENDEGCTRHDIMQYIETGRI